MYINKVKIINVKVFEDFEMNFQNKAGWHVILGDNGTGKSTLLKMISLSLLSQNFRDTINVDFSKWISNEDVTTMSSCFLQVQVDKKNDPSPELLKNEANLFFAFVFTSINRPSAYIKPILANQGFDLNEGQKIFNYNGWFSAAFGSYRQIGDKFSNQRGNFSNKKVDAHITLFRNDFSLISPVDWLLELKFKQLDSKLDKSIFDKIISFFNDTDLLPNGVQITKIDSDGIVFTDPSGTEVNLFEMSDGYQSVFGMTAEIIRQLTKQYGFEKVFSEENLNEQSINLPGVVLIDEVDIHLHPTWQAKIGNWFKKYFPKIQFIVTTHSPIICRSAENSHIWKLEHPSSDEKSRMIDEDDFNRLVHGNILDAYGTEIFGTNVTRNESSQEMLEELARLNMLESIGKLDPKDKKRLSTLQKTFSTDDNFEF